MRLPAPSTAQLRSRTRRILWFGARTVASFIWWEIVLRRVLGAGRARRGTLERLARTAREFSRLAVSMGGVLIKVGQFISARVDVLPQAITDELADLQDQVPPEAFPAIRAVVETELGKPLDEAFASFDSSVQAAASLGQVHAARLLTGDQVVVKVQRPGISLIVAADMAAVRTVVGWVRNYPPIRRRIDLMALLDEFTRTLYQELDYVQEAENARRFAGNFANVPGVYVPRVYGELSTRRVLVLEDVGAIKIADRAALDEAGVDRAEVAARLFNTYLKQWFEDGFFHADPHPGNLFIHPTGDAGARPRPFVLTFVDFGMTGHIAPSVRTHLRGALIGLTTRDSHRIVQAEAALGLFLPGTDLAPIERVTDQVFARFYGMTTEELVKLDRRELHAFMSQFRELLFEMPFQVPQDYIYLFRAAGILSGMCSSLDPHINYWTLVEPYARNMLEQEVTGGLRQALPKLADLLGLLARLPAEADRVLAKALASELEIKMSPTRELQQDLRGLTRAINRLLWGVLFAALMGAGVALLANGFDALGVTALVGAGAALLALLISLGR